MGKVIENARSQRLARALLVGTVAIAAAGCSSDVTRFSQPLFGGGSETPYTGSITPSPVPQVERQELAEPGQSGQSTFAGGGDRTSGANVVVAQSGDTAHSIARRYGVPPDALMQANNLSNPNAIRPGQQLIVPTYSQASSAGQAEEPRSQQRDTRQAALPAPQLPAAASQPQPQPPAAASQPQQSGSHRVEHGETVFSIARAHNVGPDDIIRANGLDSPDRIRVGQTLTIPGAAGTSRQASAPSSQPQPSQDQQSPAPSQPTAEERQPERVAEAETTARPVPASLTTGGEDSSGTSDASAGVSDPAPMASGTFRWPVRGRVIAAFGDSSNGTRNDGVKISVPEGTSVRAAENGVVAYAGDELKGYGNLVLIRHEDDWVSAYAHNSEIDVSRGDQVSRGQVIGKAGQSGSVNSPQLHFELRKGSQPVDPLRYLAEN